MLKERNQALDLLNGEESNLKDAKGEESDLVFAEGNKIKPGSCWGDQTRELQLKEGITSRSCCSKLSKGRHSWAAESDLGAAGTKELNVGYAEAEESNPGKC